jgi:hypothetical protein
MRFRVGKWGWPISASVVLPAGWIVDTERPLDRMDRWSREIYQRGLQSPADAILIEQETT